MKRALALALLLACGSLQACATAIIGGGGTSGKQCTDRDSRNCQTKEAF